MKEILLTQNEVALVDDEDFEKLSIHKWYAYKNSKSNVWYAARKNLKNDGKQEMVLMHRELLDATKNIQVDHRNGNGLDNKKENLRLATNQQNQFNRTYQKNNNLRIKGVYWCKLMKKFNARIHINNKRIKLGYFNVLGDADSAYRIAEEKYFGVFARAIVEESHSPII
mgnify:CR=1 FL=1